MSSKIKVDTIENVAGSGNVSLGSGHNLVVPGNITGQGTTTLTGDLAVDTDKLFVDASTDKVGINQASPTYQLSVLGATQSTVEIESASTTGESRLYMTDPDSTGVGEIGYYHNGDTMRFNTGGSERMRIGSTTGQFKFNGVYVYYFLGSVRNDTAAYVDVPGVQSAGVSLVTAQYTHHNINNYGAVRVASVASYGGGLVHALDIQNVSSSAGGSWSITMPSSGVLRVTKTAGTYAGSGFYWVKVETYYG